MITTDGQTQHYSGSINNDTTFLVYRVSISVPGAAGVLGFAGLVSLRRRC